MNDRIPGSCWSNPIWYRNWRIFVALNNPYAFVYVHDDCAPDTDDDRYGNAKTIEQAKAEIDERESQTLK